MLVCLAHPDDETFGMGGTLALYTRRGVQVRLIRGEVGEMTPELMEGYSWIGERPKPELRCAAGILGLTGVYFLKLPRLLACRVQRITCIPMPSLTRGRSSREGGAFHPLASSAGHGHPRPHRWVQAPRPHCSAPRWPASLRAGWRP